MSDIRRIVDELRFYLESTEAEMTQSVRDAARDYADSCRQANQRLRRCGDYLNRNLRSEAIQLAEAEPDLLELIATLDFTGRSNWDEVVNLYELPAAEPLLMEFAEAINEAYALQEPIKKLLDKHRFLALAHAPLKLRLAVLWQLVALEGKVGMWDSDTCEMERARLAEIDSESREAAKRLDSQTLRSLVDEIDSGHWIDATSAQVKKTIAHRLRETTTTVARTELQNIASALEAAFQDRNLGQAQALKGQWDPVALTARLDNLDPLVTRVGPVFHWIEAEESEQETRRRGDYARAELAKALDDRSTPRDELERLSHRAIKIGPELPEPLAERFKTRLAEIDKRQRNIRRIVASIVSLALVALCLCVVLLLRRSMHTAESRRSAESVTAMTASGQLLQARQFVKEHPKVYPSDEWSQALNGLTGAEDDEARRLVNLQTLIGAITKAPSYEDARSKLDDAGRLAKTEPEKARVSEVESKWEERHHDELAGKYADIEKRINAIRSHQAQADVMIASPAPPAELQPLLGQIAQEIADLPNSIGNLNSPLAQQIEPLKKRFNELQHAAEYARQKVTLAKAIRDQSSIRPTAVGSTGQVDRYIGLLTGFVSTYPNDSRTPDFKKVASERAIYHGICEWQSLAGRWTKLLPVDFDNAKKRKGECEEFVKNHRECPACALIERYSRFLSAIVRRYEADGGSKAEGQIAKLRELYNGPLMQNVHVIWDGEGNAYYLKSEADFLGKPVANIHYFSDFQGNIANKAIQVQHLKSARSEPAAQDRLSKTVIRTLDGLTVENWEASMKQISQAVLETHDLDAYLQYVLLRYTLEYASAGSLPLEIGLQKPLELLADPQLDLSVRWMLPNDMAASAARSKSTQLVAKLNDFESAWSRAEGFQRHFAQELFTRCVFVGAIERGKDGEWVCSSSWKPDGNYELVVAVPAGENSPPSWHVIGKVNNRRLELTQRAETSVLCEGRLVLARGAAPSDAVAGRSDQSEMGK